MRSASIAVPPPSAPSVGIGSCREQLRQQTLDRQRLLGRHLLDDLLQGLESGDRLERATDGRHQLLVVEDVEPEHRPRAASRPRASGRRRPCRTPAIPDRTRAHARPPRRAHPTRDRRHARQPPAAAHPPSPASSPAGRDRGRSRAGHRPAGRPRTVRPWPSPPTPRPHRGHAAGRRTPATWRPSGRRRRRGARDRAPGDLPPGTGAPAPHAACRDAPRSTAATRVRARAPPREPTRRWHRSTTARGPRPDPPAMSVTTTATPSGHPAMPTADSSDAPTTVPAAHRSR